MHDAKKLLIKHVESKCAHKSAVHMPTITSGCPDSMANRNEVLFWPREEAREITESPEK